MKWDLKLATHQEELLFLTLCIVTGLLLLSFIRIALLLRQRRKMAGRADKLEKQILDQQRIIQDIRSDSNAWRGEMQRQFDAFRAESSRTIEAADLRIAEVQTRLDKSLAFGPASDEGSGRSMKSMRGPLARISGAPDVIDPEGFENEMKIMA